MSEFYILYQFSGYLVPDSIFKIAKNATPNQTKNNFKVNLQTIEFVNFF